MAIDKALEDQIKVPKQVIPGEEVPIETPESDIGSDDVEIQMTDDGGAEIDFDPTAMAAQAAMQHDANLAEFLEDDNNPYCNLLFHLELFPLFLQV
jgi:hypothetical protein